MSATSETIRRDPRRKRVKAARAPLARREISRNARFVYSFIINITDINVDINILILVFVSYRRFTYILYRAHFASHSLGTRISFRIPLVFWKTQTFSLLRAHFYLYPASLIQFSIYTVDNLLTTSLNF